MMLLKKTIYDKLVAKANSIDTSGFVLKTKYDTDKSEIEKKFLILVVLVKRQIIMIKLLKYQEGKIPSISGLPTNALLTAVENKILNINSLVKKRDYDVKITEIEKALTDHNHDKFIATSEFNILAADIFHSRLAQANLITKADFDAKLSSLHRKTTTNKTKHLLVEKTKNILFGLLYWQKSFWRSWYAKLFSISTNTKIF